MGEKKKKKGRKRGGTMNNLFEFRDKTGPKRTKLDKKEDGSGGEKKRRGGGDNP